MAPSDDNQSQNTSSSSERLDRLVGDPSKRSKYNPKYSKFIKTMRLVLPLAALSLLAIVFSWGTFTKDDILPQIDPAQAPQTIGKNELLNPRFESMDDKNQPYTITAKRAIQGETNEDLVILEDPLADILMQNGNWIAIKAEQGAYRQDNERLLLKGDVNIFHDQGYQLTTQELNVDMAANLAWSEIDVYAQGPAGNLEAKGLQGNTSTGLLIFNGPARLVLYDGFNGFNLSGDGQ